MVTDWWSYYTGHKNAGYGREIFQVILESLWHNFIKYIISMVLVDIKRRLLQFYSVIHDLLVRLFGILTHQDACGLFLVCLKETMKIMTTLYCMCIIWSPIKPISSNAHTDTEAKTHGLQLHDGSFQIPKTSVRFIRHCEPDRSFLQAKGQVWRRTDISPSLTHSLQRQRLSLVTHSDSTLTVGALRDVILFYPRLLLDTLCST